MWFELSDFTVVVAKSPWLQAALVAAVALITFLILYTIKRHIFNRLESHIENGASSKWTKHIFDSLSVPVTIIILMISLAVSLQIAPESIRTYPIWKHIVRVGTLIAIARVVERFLVISMLESHRLKAMSSNFRTLLITFTRITVLGLLLLSILDTFGISITPILASLGIGSIAVALALQDTLSNFFSGVYLLVDQPLRIGDTIRFDNVEGVIKRIGWRTTYLLQGSNSTLIIPNSKLATSVFTNFDLHDPVTSVKIEFKILYNNDLEKVERVTRAAAVEVAERIPGVVKHFDPLVRFQSILDGAILTSLTMRVKHVSDSDALRHELIKSLSVVFKHEKIALTDAQLVVRNSGAN